MKIRERYRRLTFWNKFTVCGSVASILSIPLAIIFWCVSIAPSDNVQLTDVLEKLAQKKSDNQTESIVTRTFWLTREKGSSISIGPCPSEKCLEITLDKLEYKNGITTQFFHLKGGSLGIRKWIDKSGPKPMYGVGMSNTIKIEGAAFGLNYSRPGMLVTLDLHKNSFFEMYTEYAYIKFTVVDLRVDSLKIKLEIYPPSGLS